MKRFIHHKDTHGREWLINPAEIVHASLVKGTVNISLTSGEKVTFNKADAAEVWAKLRSAGLDDVR